MSIEELEPKTEYEKILFSENSKLKRILYDLHYDAWRVAEWIRAKEYALAEIGANAAREKIKYTLKIEEKNEREM